VATVTLKDIALALDVSVMTVSKVMRNRPGVKQDTRNRVLAKAKELNYECSKKWGVRRGTAFRINARPSRPSR